MGLHFVLMGVTGIVVVASVVELAFEQHAHGANIHNLGESLWWAIVTGRPELPAGPDRANAGPGPGPARQIRLNGCTRAA
jgi:hypothetical protein